MYDCIVESHESKRQRAESSQSKTHEDHIAGKGFISMAHYNLVHKFFSDATSDENSRTMRSLPPQTCEVSAWTVIESAGGTAPDWSRSRNARL